MEQCTFKKEEFSIDVVLLLAWFELLILVPVGTTIFIIFDWFILAPTQKHVETQLNVKHTIARRLSIVGNGISSQVIKGMRRLSTVGNQLKKRLSVTVVPEIEMKKRVRSVKMTILVDDHHLETRRSAINLLPYIRNQRHQLQVMDHRDTDIDIAQLIYQQAVNSIKAYRFTLNDVDELDDFDRQWEKYFPRKDTNVSNTNRYDVFSKSFHTEIFSIHEHSSELYDNLKNLPPHVCGLEILKLFFIDLLGKDTEEAKIFESQFEDNLKAKRVVSIYLKAFMILLMIILNVYFVYISLLYCSDKSYEWQFNWYQKHY